MVLIILAENKIRQTSAAVGYRQGVQLMLPDDIVRFLQSTGVMNELTCSVPDIRETL